MEQNSVSGFLKVCSRSLGSEQNPEVRVEEHEPNEDETNDVRGVSLLQAVGAPEHHVPDTERLGVEELQRLSDQEDEEVG